MVALTILAGLCASYPAELRAADAKQPTAPPAEIPPPSETSETSELSMPFEPSLEASKDAGGMPEKASAVVPPAVPPVVVPPGGVYPAVVPTDEEIIKNLEFLLMLELLSDYELFDDDA